MRTYKEVLEDGIQLLETAAIEEARLDAWLLLEYTADITRAWYYAHMDDGLDAKTEERYRTLCTKRAQHIPLQHITGRAYFMGYEYARPVICCSGICCSILPGVHILWDTNFVWMNVYLYRDRIQRCLWKKRFPA